MKYVIADDPCHIGEELKNNWYPTVMKRFLVIYALGMTANTLWKGSYQANGGYIVITETGDIVCYHFYDRNQLENYLYTNTSFDTPSTERHNFHTVWRDDDGRVYLKLNPQIRFIHAK